MPVFWKTDPAVFFNDQGRQEELVRFYIIVGYTVVADLRVSHDYHLAGIGWVAQDLLVDGQGGVEYNFTIGIDQSAETPSSKYSPILKYQSRVNGFFDHFSNLAGLIVPGLK